MFGDTAQAVDLVLHGGLVADGSGSAPKRSDIGVRGTRIVAIGDLAGARRREAIDVSGRLLMPGFVDAHSHADGRIGDPDFELASLRQGVTTVVLGQDGISYAPASAETGAELDRYFDAVNGPRPPGLPAACSVADLLTHHDRRGSVNVAYLVPAGNVRADVVGFRPGLAATSELSRMRALVESSLEEGAVGLSSGLEYVPGCYANLDELTSLCEVVAAAGGVYVSHMRGYEEEAPSGMTEVQEIATASRVAAHVSHYHGPAALLVPLIAETQAAGVDLTFDTYPYRRGSTTLAMLALPRALQAGGPAETLNALSDPEVRGELQQSWFPTIAGLLSRITLSYVSPPEWAWAEGTLLTVVAERLDLPVGELVCELLVTASLGVGCVIQQPESNTAEDVRTLLRHPSQMASSDGILVGGHPHPRARGAFARFLGRHTRELKDWSWGEAAVHLSASAANRFGLMDRGLLHVGHVADIAVVDTARVGDRATYDEPLALANGIDDVIVNGQLVLRGGALTGVPAGRAVRRGERPE